MFSFKKKNIEKIAVIGSGQIGPDIALYFSKVFARHAVPVVVLDVAQDALDQGKAKTHKKIDKGVDAGAFKPEAAAAMKDNITFTNDYDAAAGAQIVIEAASEDKGIKNKIFQQLEAVCPPDALFVSNSSHMEPEVIFENLASKQRSMVTHYFFPAERNPIVEVVPGRETDPALTEWVMDLLQWMGKVPLQVGSRYGYAIDPVFEGLFQAAALCVEAGLGTTKEVDEVARQTLGLGVGPFTAMNLTGGNPITDHGLDQMNQKIMPWFKSPSILKEAVTKSASWEVAARGEKVDVDEKRAAQVSKRMLGAYFGLASEVLDSGIINISDLELGLELALVIKGPFKAMNEIGVRDAARLVTDYAAENPGFKVAAVLQKQAEQNKPWKVPVILRHDRDGVAILTFRRPAVLNAINDEAIVQLRERAEEVAKDDSVRAVVLTGYGSKAFVSGADIGFLAKLETAEAAERMSLDFQGSIAALENMSKPVVCAMNGVAFGGGCEIAMGCHARIAPKRAKLLAAQPEVNLGLIPGAGGTQRLPRIVGFDTANGLLRTGRPLSAEAAHEIGLVDRLSEGDLVEDAVAFALEIADGKESPKPMEKNPLSPPDKLPEVDLGHLSTAVDKILCRAVIEGGRMTLDEGLKLEAKLFGEVCLTEDKKIGTKNFIEKGARSKAEFVHR